jgi:small subunit ribosomal protein S20
VEVTAKERESNNSKRTRVRNAVKKFAVAVQSKDAELAAKLLPETISIIDKAYCDGIYPRNTAARKKSTVNKLYNSLKAE